MSRSPKTQFVAITFDDGSVGIMQFVVQQYHPSTGAVVWEQMVSDEAINAEIARSAFDRAVTGWRLIEPGDVPEDRSYRGAWTDDGKAISHDMEKAREIQREKLREARKPLLEALDVDVIKAQTETKDARAVASAVAEKQRLRDVTDDPRIDAAQSVEELKAITLDK
jgi:hypothetical protein